MSFPRYPKYKPSGVEWLGEVPDGWEAKPLKYSTLVYTGNSLNETEKKLYESTDPEALPYISSKDIDLETHEVQYENGLRIPKGQCGLKVAPSGSFLLCVEGGSAGRKVALLRHDVCFVNKLCCFSSRQNNKFRFYFSQSQNFKDKFGLSLTGLIGGVSTSLLKNFQIPTPSDSEQTAIAEFLDRETAKIDELVAEQRRLMELLKEKRQAVISHAVTKGLNPHAPMKPSGIEWLGDVPAGWEVAPLKIVASHNDDTLDEKTEPDLEILYVDISGVDAIEGIKTKEPMVYSDAPSRARRRVKHGDTIVSTVRTYLRAIAQVRNPEENLIVSTGFAVVRPRARLSPDYVGYVLSAGYFIEQVIARSTGVSYPAINASDLVRIPVALPPLPEQTAIAEFLNSESAKFDTLTAEAQRAIDLLQERRTALISAAVTGQIDVRQHSKTGGAD